MDAECVQDLFPSGDLTGEVLPVRSSLDGNKIEDFHSGLLVREMPPMSHRFAELRVEAFYRVGGVHDLAQLDGELQQRHKLVPRVFPRLDHRRIRVAPRAGERLELCLRRFDLWVSKTHLRLYLLVSSLSAR